MVELRCTEYANADLDYLIQKPEKLINFNELYGLSHL